MNYELMGVYVLSTIIILAWVGIAYCAFNRDYQRKKHARMDVELSALKATGQDRLNPTDISV